MGEHVGLRIRDDGALREEIKEAMDEGKSVIIRRVGKTRAALLLKILGDRRKAAGDRYAGLSPQLVRSSLRSSTSLGYPTVDSLRAAGFTKAAIALAEFDRLIYHTNDGELHLSSNGYVVASRLEASK